MGSPRPHSLGLAWSKVAPRARRVTYAAGSGDSLDWTSAKNAS